MHIISRDDRFYVTAAAKDRLSVFWHRWLEERRSLTE
jgi:hypothetical protein